jgi:hypothetical protein
MGAAEAEVATLGAEHYAAILLLGLNVALTLAATLGAFVLKHVWSSLIDLRVADERLADKVSNTRSTIEESFVRVSQLRDALDPLREHLTRIEAKLDRKVDRSECQVIHHASQNGITFVRRSDDE